MVFVGPSGRGKSTVLRMIAGLEDITAGTIEIDGKVVNEIEPKDRGIAMVFQTYEIFPHMTVRENMAFGLTIKGASKAEKNEKVAKAARILQMEDLLDRRPSQLSGGQRQRAGNAPFTGAVFAEHSGLRPLARPFGCRGCGCCPGCLAHADAALPMHLCHGGSDP